MTSTDAAVRKLDLGRVFGDTFGVIRRQAGPLFGLTVVLTYLPNLFNILLRAGHPTTEAALQAYANPLYSLGSLVASLLGAYAIACQYDIAIGDLEGRRIALPGVFRSALGKFLPIIGAILLMVLGLALGFVLLLVPGVILGVMWVVALPSVVADTSNPVKALGRSRALTKGNRWRIFGLLLLLWILVIIVEGVFFGAAGAIGVSLRAASAGLLTLAAISLIGVVISVCVTVGSAALYVQLRELKGVGGESVAQVFA